MRSLSGEGYRTLFQGFTATALRDAPYAGVFLVVYEGFKQNLGTCLRSFLDYSRIPSILHSLFPITSEVMIPSEPFGRLLNVRWGGSGWPSSVCPVTPISGDRKWIGIKLKLLTLRLNRFRKCIGPNERMGTNNHAHIVRWAVLVLGMHGHWRWNRELTHSRSI